MHDFNRAAKPAIPVPPTSHALFEASSAEPRKANLKGYAPLSQRSDWQHLGICWFKTLVKTLLVNYQWESKMTPRGGISCPCELPRVFLRPRTLRLNPTYLQQRLQDHAYMIHHNFYIYKKITL